MSTGVSDELTNASEKLNFAVSNLIAVDEEVTALITGVGARRLMEDTTSAPRALQAAEAAIAAAQDAAAAAGALAIALEMKMKAPIPFNNQSYVL